MSDPLRHQRKHEASPFGGDRFGQLAERFARFFGTSRFIIGQSVLVLVWIALNGTGLALQWDAFPFVLLNLAFSTQAAYAAPLILLAQTRQADRDKATAHGDAHHREELHAQLVKLVDDNTTLTERVAALTAEIHRKVK